VIVFPDESMTLWQLSALLDLTIKTSGDRITTAFEQAKATSRPVVVLIGDEYHGFNR
jgi:hypothetical protein